ncbi:MAG: hypothetical protein WBE92_09255 [Steroidobacteraceae bacterium]
MVITNALQSPTAVCTMAILCALLAQPARADGTDQPNADNAFLQGLYSTGFGMKINLEQGQINQQFVRGLGR